jgi:Ti-type conjugative transfer relaxase TraA
MAIFHLSTKIVSRNTGRTALAAAAYRSGDRLEQDGIDGAVHDYTRKGGVVHTEILAPPGAPAWMHDREALWNDVDRLERQKNSQLAREIEVALPVELNLAQQVELLRTFAENELVARGMIADVAVHHDNPRNPHAHILLTMRTVGPEGFGPKDRSWNDRGVVRRWREAWAAETNRQLALAGSTARVDHRSFAEQGLSLTPGRKLGVGVERQASPFLPGHLASRVAEQDEIKRSNGERILADPVVALDALTRNTAAFSRLDLERYLAGHTDGSGQYAAALQRLLEHADVVKVWDAERDRELMTTRTMLALEQELLGRAVRMSERPGYRIPVSKREQAIGESRLSPEQRAAVERISRPGYLALFMGAAGTGKSTTLAVARELFESEGYQVKGAALAGIAAENLERASGIPSRTIASYENSWEQGRDPLTARDVLIVDEAGMVGTRQLARVLEKAEKAHAKVILVGDAEQVQPIEAGGPFRALLSALGSAELRDVRRQKEAWQRVASTAFADTDARTGLAAYEKRGFVHEHATRSEARDAIIKSWARREEYFRNGTQVIVAHTRKDVDELNAAARAWRVERGHVLDEGVSIATDTGEKEFAINDRVRFRQNNSRIGIKNGTLGTILDVTKDKMVVEVADGDSTREVWVDLKFYGHIDYGYATTIHKAQGATVDATMVLATPGLDRHLTYVAMTRHRFAAELHYAAEDFTPKAGRAQRSDARTSPRDRLYAALSRAAPKHMAMDYREHAESDREPTAEAAAPGRVPGALEAMRARYREREDHERARSGGSGEASTTPARARSSTPDPVRVDAAKDRPAARDASKRRDRDFSR